jgi:hypothetical protein
LPKQREEGTSGREEFLLGVETLEDIWRESNEMHSECQD